MSGWEPAFEDAAHAGVDPRLAGCRLTVDLAALVENYRMLVERAAPARVAAVVKADAYGLGAERVCAALWAAGCRTFFVALPGEGIALRAALPDAEIFVLNGLFGPEAAPAYGQYRLIPVLGSQADLACWEAFGWDGDVPRPCAIHVDTGMNRLGLTADEAYSMSQENALTGALSPVLVMSHLACADMPGHPMNAHQCECFRAVRRAFADAESSLSNSAGTLLGDDYAFDLVRPGIALYGGNPFVGLPNPMAPVVTAEARVVQVRQVKAGDTASYGATSALARDTTVAVVSAGYADGFPRAASGSGVDQRRLPGPAAHGFLHGRAVPVLGRVTMDLTLFDVTDLGPGAVSAGDWVELFGRNVAIDEVADAAGTIAYELLTRLGKRYHRRYTGGEVE